MIKTLLCLCVALGACLAHAQVTVDEVLGHMPAKDAAEANWAYSTLAENVRQNTAELCNRLAKVGDNSDVNVRYALTGLANYVVKPGAESARADYNSAICEALPGAPDDEAKAFLMEMLRTSGNDASVACVATFLKGNERLASEARYTLEAIGGDAAAQALAQGPHAAADYPRNTSVMDPPPQAEAFMAAYAAEAAGSAAAWGVMYKALQSEFGTTRAAAAEVAAKDFPGEFNNKRIARLLKEAPAPMAPDYISLIGRRGGETALKVLPQYLDSDDARTAEAAAAALARLRTPEADAALMDWLNKVEPGDDYDAAVALLNKAGAHRLMPKPDEEGFTPIFNGQNLDDWTGWKRGYEVQEGAIVCKKASLNLYTKRQFADFILRFEFKVAPAANNGIGIRAPLKGKASEFGMEVQVIDHDDPSQQGIEPWQVNGSIYGIVAAKKCCLKPAGEWNQEEIRAEGHHLVVVVNGETVVDANIEEAIAKGTPDGKDHQGALRTKGHIGFLGHGDEVAFRNLRVKELE